MKTVNILPLVLVVMMADFGFAQTWTHSFVHPSCTGIASSADGSKLVVAVFPSLVLGTNYNGSVYTSTNSGASWITNNVPSVSWRCVASSADGTILAALAPSASFLVNSCLLYSSTNSGTTWISNNAPIYPLDSSGNSLNLSADGSELVAMLKNQFFISTNLGVSWVSTNNSEVWKAVACSADGAKFVAFAGAFGTRTPGTYTSTNLGNSWTLVNSLSGNAIASSADGTKLAAISGNLLYASADSGFTWTPTSTTVTNWNSIASSADGSRLVAVAGYVSYNGPPGNYYYGPIFTSTNSGLTWMSNAAPALQIWNSVASSADGGLLVAANEGGIWTSQTTPSPSINISPTDGNLLFSWTLPSTNFVLQQSADLVSWTDVTNPHALNFTNLQNQVTLPPSNRSGFYRLKTP